MKSIRLFQRASIILISLLVLSSCSPEPRSPKPEPQRKETASAPSEMPEAFAASYEASVSVENGKRLEAALSHAPELTAGADDVEKGNGEKKFSSDPLGEKVRLLFDSSENILMGKTEPDSELPILFVFDSFSLGKAADPSGEDLLAWGYCFVSHDGDAYVRLVLDDKEKGTYEYSLEKYSYGGKEISVNGIMVEEEHPEGEESSL